MNTSAIAEPLVPKTDAADSPSVPSELPRVEPITAFKASRTTLLLAVTALGAIAFFYFARPVLLPIFLAFVVAITLKPLIRWLLVCHIPTPLGAAIVMALIVSAIGFGFLQL